MRTNEQRIAALHARAAGLQKAKRDRRVRLIGVAGASLCLGATLFLALLAPRFSALSDAPTARGALSASLFTECPTLHFLAIAIVAFLLGVTATVFCFRLRTWHNQREAALRQEEAETRQSEEAQ